MSAKSAESGHGVWYALGAYFCWGLFPLYWKPLEQISPLQILCHRLVWSALFVFLLLVVRRQWEWLQPFRREPKRLVFFMLSSLMLSSNWLLYIWAVNSGHIVESSLGYFINPLVNVSLGRLVLGERLNRPQKLAVALAACGVLWLTLQLGAVPWVALGLAVSFGLYGLMRKRAPLPSLEGLALETFLLAPLALVWLIVLEWRGVGRFGHLPGMLNLMLVSAGVVTAVPLLLFAHGARRLKLATLGIIQYVSPSLQLLLGVAIYHEAFDATRAIGFALIWAALLLYSGSSLRALLRAR
ncbi:MAG: EamA family transporter RarD [Paludibacterium sp.]|uniref:EamA family transporter RarD n=1 Tax=Paludibacterium sp. TaxID=1917523 RepID=UPI0025DB1C46|nr:EamA family transporter RarD [Paludibacterium sp.]MBV8046234.1 EamA family transporter RarD [Paludibacterium sp.]MBV8649446.1 EamA family transporter RarD [Paludibacterium sp.]